VSFGAQVGKDSCLPHRGVYLEELRVVSLYLSMKLYLFEHGSMVMHNIVDIASNLAILLCAKNNNESRDKGESSHHTSK
jgi:hypothetical protein